MIDKWEWPYLYLRKGKDRTNKINDMQDTPMKLENTEFAGYRVDYRMSCHHDGEREVYLARDADGGMAVLTVFNLSAPRYSTDSNDDDERDSGDRLDRIAELRFIRRYAKENADMPGIPRLLGSGIETRNANRYAWMAQEHITGMTLQDEFKLRKTLTPKEAYTAMQNLMEVMVRIARHTHGGGHYNICPSNLLLSYDYTGNLKGSYLTGLSNIGGICGGSPQMDTDSMDWRFQAPETRNGIYGYRQDIYALGLLLMMMLTGKPEPADMGLEPDDEQGMRDRLRTMTSADYRKAMWRHAGNLLPRVTESVLEKATDQIPGNRFGSMERFSEFIRKIARKELAADGGKAACQRSAGEKALNDTARQELASVRTNQGKGGGFEEVAGMAELKALFRRDFIRIVRNPEIARAYGIKPSNATLLYGPQGCGKTFIAEHAARESGLKYKIIRPSDLGSIYVHGTQQKIAETFADAEKNGPMILIFDEFDAFVPKRDGMMQENQAGEVNEMLVQLNNCAERGVYCLCTSNRPERIDPAVLRKGRIDRSIYVSLPDFEARKQLFRLSLDNRPVDSDIDYGSLADITENYTCSDIAYIVDEVSRRCFEETLDKDLNEPLPISMANILEIAKTTSPSVSEAQRKEFLRLKDRMESRDDSGHVKVGFMH